MADLAESLYEESHARLSKQEGETPQIALLDAGLDRMAAAIWLLQAECLFRMTDDGESDLANWDSLTETANKIVNRCSTDESECDEREGQYYVGLTLLNSLHRLHGRKAAIPAVGAPDPRDSTELAAASALQAFRTSVVSDEEGGFAPIYVAAMEFETGDYDGAVVTSENYLAVHRSSTSSRIRGEARAQIEIVNAINIMTSFALGGTAPEFGCDIDAGAIPVEDGILIEQFVMRALKERHRHAVNQESQYAEEAFGRFCVDFIMSLRRACADAACSGCQPFDEERAHERDGLLADFRLPAGDGQPIYSRGDGLGHEIGGRRYFKFQIEVTEWDPVTQKTVKTKEITKAFAVYDLNDEVRPGPYIPMEKEDLARLASGAEKSVYEKALLLW
jgi:hypothetical protein